jgi:hypothetical protein
VPLDVKEIILSKVSALAAKKNIVVSTVGAWQHKKDGYVPWY